MSTKKDDLQAKITELSSENSELKAKLKYATNVTIGQQVSKTMNTAIRFGAFAYIALCVKDSLETLSGKTTQANISVAAIADFNFLKLLNDPKIICLAVFAFGVLAVIYGMLERRLRKNTVRRLHKRLETYEKEVDPKRTSSNLTPTGDTNPEDK